MGDKHKWSKYQIDIFKDVSNGSGNTAILAFAGSAKTTTIVESLKYVPRGKKTLVVAFNKIIQEELQKKVPSYVDCLTLHSLGYRALKLHFGNEIALDESKVFKILKDILSSKEEFEYIEEIIRAVSIAKATLSDTPKKIEDLIDSYSIETGCFTIDEFCKLIIKVLTKCKEMKHVIDFDDMIYFCVSFNINVGKWDYVFIDECQDLNYSQILLALSALKKDGRVFAIGDKMQAIYSFRAADYRVVESIIDKLNPKKLPLPICYRCPKKVVYLAQKYVPDIQCPDTSDDGYVEDISYSNIFTKAKPGDFILSRTNAPLTKCCLNFLKLGIPANIQGRDIGISLLALVKKIKAKNISTFLTKLEKYEEEETKRLFDNKKDPSYLKDKIECIKSICDSVSTVDELINSIKNMFVEITDDNRIILSTVHKAKGRERDNVFVLKYTLKDGQNQEENNIAYVAYTRAKKNLYLVSKDYKKI